MLAACARNGAAFCSALSEGAGTVSPSICAAEAAGGGLAPDRLDDSTC